LGVYRLSLTEWIFPIAPGIT